MIEFSFCKPRALLLQQNDTVKILGLTKSHFNFEIFEIGFFLPQNLHLGSLKEVNHTPGPENPCYAQTKKSLAML